MSGPKTCLEQFLAVARSEPGYELDERLLGKEGFRIFQRVVCLYADEARELRNPGIGLMDVAILKYHCGATINKMDKERPTMKRGRRKVVDGEKVSERPEHAWVDQYNVDFLETWLGKLPQRVKDGLPEAYVKVVKPQEKPRSKKAQNGPAGPNPSTSLDSASGRKPWQKWDTEANEPSTSSSSPPPKPRANSSPQKKGLPPCSPAESSQPPQPQPQPDFGAQEPERPDPSLDQIDQQIFGQLTPCPPPPPGIWRTEEGRKEWQNVYLAMCLHGADKVIELLDQNISVEQILGIASGPQLLVDYSSWGIQTSKDEWEPLRIGSGRGGAEAMRIRTWGSKGVGKGLRFG